MNHFIDQNGLYKGLKSFSLIHLESSLTLWIACGNFSLWNSNMIVCQTEIKKSARWDGFSRCIEENKTYKYVCLLSTTKALFVCVQLENDSALQASMIYIHVYPNNINKKSIEYEHSWWGTGERLEMTLAGTFVTFSISNLQKLAFCFPQNK